MIHSTSPDETTAAIVTRRIFRGASVERERAMVGIGGAGDRGRKAEEGGSGKKRRRRSEAMQE